MENHDIKYTDVSRETFDIVDHEWSFHRSAISEYTNALMWWNNRLNLISRHASRLVIDEHIKHSLIIGTLDSFHDFDRYIDVGTGGGLPGMPLAISDEEKEFFLNDISEKKCVAINDMIAKASILNAEVIHGDLGGISWPEGVKAVVSKHAFKMHDLFKLLEPFPWERAYILKGKNFEQELESVGIPLTIHAYNLEAGTIKSFYNGKYLLQIDRV